MFIATGAERFAKLRRSGMYSCLFERRPMSVGTRIPLQTAPTELGGSIRVVVTINMALLTELFLEFGAWCFSLTPSIRAVGPWRNEQRHMIGGGCISDPEAHRHPIQETDL